MRSVIHFILLRIRANPGQLICQSQIINCYCVYHQPWIIFIVMIQCGHIIHNTMSARSFTLVVVVVGGGGESAVCCVQPKFQILKVTFSSIDWSNPWQKSLSPIPYFICKLVSPHYEFFFFLTHWLEALSSFSSGDFPMGMSIRPCTIQNKNVHVQYNACSWRKAQSQKTITFTGSLKIDLCSLVSVIDNTNWYWLQNAETNIYFHDSFAVCYCYQKLQ